MELTKGQRERFENKINKSAEGGCWEWNGCLHSNGYGLAGLNGKHYRAHRLSYMIEKGVIPDGLYLLHSCDNKICVNPAHLTPGTHVENMADMKEKGRANREPKRRFTMDQIKTMLESGKSISVLSAEYGCHPRTIERIRQRYELVEEEDQTNQTI